MKFSDEFRKLLAKIFEEKDRLVALVVHLNDTYLIEERPHRLPGLPRVIATINHLRQHVREVIGEDRVLVLHSGDFLGPSLLANVDEGESMVDLLEKARLDFCVLGNHEFDHGAGVLADHVEGRRFKILSANIRDRTGLLKVHSHAIWPSASQPLVALTGVVSKSVSQSFQSPSECLLDDPIAWEFEPVHQSLLRFMEETKDAPFRLILSHATQAEDRELRQEIPSSPRTYILGGHDHDIEWIEDDKDVWVMKNLANCETVRVCLLLAAGESVTTRLLMRVDQLREDREINGDGLLAAAPTYPKDLESVLFLESSIDKRAIRTRLGRDFRIGQSLESDLYELLLKLHYKPDLLSWKLRYPDHLPAGAPDSNFVNAALSKIPYPDLNKVVLDLSTKINEPLEARDSYLRRRQTNFGNFVAECVRIHGGVQVAIINAGSFRCDRQLDPKLLGRDIRETFLYDNDGAIITIELDTPVIDALLKHGDSMSNLGAYPQVSDKRPAGGGKFLVAISSYLLTRGDSIDGYNKVCPTAIKAAVSNAKPKTFSITDALMTEAMRAQYVPPPPTNNADAGLLIELLKNFVDIFFDEVETGSATQREKDRLFGEWLGGDGPIASRPMREARDAVRGSLRRLPEVIEYEQKVGGGKRVDRTLFFALLSAAEAALLKLQSEVAKHDFVFRDRADYRWLFDVAARGLPGWNWRPWQPPN